MALSNFLHVGVVGQKWGKIWSQAYNTDCNSKQTKILHYSVLVGNMTWFLKPFLKHSIPDTILFVKTNSNLDITPLFH